MHCNKVSQTQSAVGVDSCSLDLGGEGVDQTGRKDAPGIVDVGLGEGKPAISPQALGTNLTKMEQDPHGENKHV